MATLTIRNLPERVHQALRLRAARNERSVEAEVRALLENATTAGAQLGAVQEGARAAFIADAAPSFVGVWAKAAKSRKNSKSRLHSEDFIAGRRLEAAYEADAISAKERAELEARLEALEIDLGGIEEFLAKRAR